MVCSHGQGGIELVRTRGKGVNFLQFCADVFHGQPLIRILFYQQQVEKSNNGPEKQA